MRKKETVIYCDNPDCDEWYVEGMDEVPGYHFLKGYWVLGGGGPIPRTYACSDACIVPALRHTIEESL